MFHDAALAEKGKALVKRECRRLSGVLKPTTLAEAKLRPEDSAAFLEKLVKGELDKETFASPDSIGKLTVACSDEEGGAWMEELEFKSPEEVGPQNASLFDEAVAIGDAAAPRP